MAKLDFDPIERAAQLWEERIGDATSMRFVTSLMRAQQLVLARLEAALRPHGITFARYEVLRLLSFSRSGSLPLSKIGERLMVHPTSVTNAIDRLVAQGFVDRVAASDDRRRVLASLTPAGQRVLDDATAALVGIDFAASSLTGEQMQEATSLLGVLRREDWSP